MVSPDRQTSLGLKSSGWRMGGDRGPGGLVSGGLSSRPRGRVAVRGAHRGVSAQSLLFLPGAGLRGRRARSGTWHKAAPPLPAAPPLHTLT